MNRRALAILGASLLAAVPLFTQPMSDAAAQSAPDSGDADAHYKRGVDYYKEADYAAALIEFRRAYELSPAWQVLYNIAESYYQLPDYANALKSFEQYLKDGGTNVPVARREEVQKEVDKLRTRVATLDLTSTLPGVDIAIDDVPVGKTPLTGLLVSAGRRKVTATAPGKQPVTQIVELAGGDKKQITIPVAADTPAPTASVTAPPTATALATDSAAQVPPPSRSVPVAPWVVTGVLAAGWAVTGGLALGASGSEKTKLAQLPGNAKDIKSAHDQAAALALVSDILGGAAIVGLGVSIVLTATAGPSKDASPAPPKAGAPRERALRAAAELRVSPALGGAVITGSF